MTNAGKTYIIFRCKGKELYSFPVNVGVGMKKDYRLAILFDCYGELLTPRQKDIFDQYINEDYSLSEIAENNDVSRQAVHDAINRAESILLDAEEKIGMVERITAMEKALQQAAALAEKVISVSGDNELKQLASELLEKTSAF